MYRGGWPEFYRGRLLAHGYLEYFEGRYKPFLDAIRKEMKEGDRIVEAGCGLATTTKLLIDGKHPFVGYHCYDINPEMVWLAKVNIAPYEAVDIGDCRFPSLCRPDIVHSHGLLEHFTDDDIRKVLMAHEADDPRVAIHYVPGEGHGKPSYGDERLLKMEYWLDVHKPTEAFAFNEGKDYVLTWRY